MATESGTSRLGRYQLVKELGRGSMGVVYLAVDPYIDRQVAVKIANHVDEGSSAAPDKYNQQFFHEARTAGRLTHPNIVAVYDADVYQGSCYIVMEHVSGPTVREFCCADDLLPLDKSAEIIFSSCRALDYAHGMNVVHRDIKPSNIMLTGEGTAKITDFGIAQLTESTVQLTLVGTPHYMSPEQIEDELVDGRSDIFSLGCVLYELLTGRKAFPGDTPAQIINKIINHEPVPLHDLRPEIPRSLAAITEKSLRKNPGERYQTCADLAYELRVAMRQLKGNRKAGKADTVTSYTCNIPFFQTFTKEQVQTLMEASTVFSLGRGEVVVSEGEVDDSLFIILSGEVAVRKGDRHIDVVGRGECFGEMAYLSGLPREATIESATDCILLKISATLMDRSPQPVQLLFLKGFATILARRLSQNNARIVSLMNSQQSR